MEKFADLMVNDTKLGTCYRADKYLTEYIKGILTKKKKIPAELAKEYAEVIVKKEAFID